MMKIFSIIPTIYFSYIHKNDLTKIKYKLNKIKPTIDFTYDLKTNNTLSF